MHLRSSSPHHAYAAVTNTSNSSYERPHAGFSLPPGLSLTHSYETSQDGVFLELDGPRQPDTYVEGKTFPGGISLYVTGEDPQRELVAACTIWALHEALEFVTDEDGRRLADPHPEDEELMWSWLRVEVERLLSEYRERWPLAEKTEDDTDDGTPDLRGVQPQEP